MKFLLIAYDNDSYIHEFPLGLAYVATALKNDGWDVSVYSQDVYHYPEEHLTKYLDMNHFDAVGIGMCGGYYQYNKLLNLADAINDSKDRPELWLGGHLVSPDPEYFKRITEADKICVGDFCDVVNLKPAFDLFHIEYYALIRKPHATNSDRCMSILSGHGCPFHCNFCYRMTDGYHPREIEDIVIEIQHLQLFWGINYIDFADELLMVGEERTRKICEALKYQGIKWMCNGRLNYAIRSTLKAMRESGCVFINYGIEQFDDEALEKMGKKLTCQQIEDGVKNTLAEGISPGLNFIWGNIGDTRETLKKSVDFLLKYDDHTQMRTIRPVTPYPGSPLFDYAVEKGMIKDVADFYENKHKNSDLPSVQFTGLSNAEFNGNLKWANSTLIEKYHKVRDFTTWKQLRDLYDKNDTSFRGFRQT